MALDNVYPECGSLFVEMLQADAALCHLATEHREALLVLEGRA